MDSEMNNDFLKTISEPSLEIASDLLELGIDELIKNDAVTKLPVVGGLIALGKTALAVRDAIYVKNILALLSGVTVADADMRQKWFDRLKNDNEADKAGDVIFAIVDRLNDRMKNRIAGVLLAHHIQGNYTFRHFEHLCEKLERLYIADILMLQKSFPQHDADKERFVSYGLYSADYLGNDGSKFVLNTDRNLVPNADLDKIMAAIKVSK